MRRSTMAWVVAPALMVGALAPHAAQAAGCTFGASAGGEVSLQGVFNEMFGATLAPNAQTSCVADPNDGLWHTVSSAGSATILVEIAGNLNGNTLGIYDSTSTLRSLEIFSGPAGSASRAYITVSNSGPGAYNVQIDRYSDGAPPVSVSGTFASSAFGFYLQQPAGAGNERFYSESVRNAGRNGDPTATDYMYSYTGNGAYFLNGSLYAPTIVEGTQFDSDDAIIAWEDLRNGSDGDYQDMVVLLRDVVPNASPVPLPAAFWLFGTALAGLGAFRRRAPARETF